MDVLSDVLRVIHLQGAIFFTADLSGPWSVESPTPERLARLLGIRAECLSLFHLVVAGRCWFALEDAEPVEARGGDLVILPRGDAHRLGSDLSLPPVRLKSVFYSWSGPEVPRLARGSGGDPTRLVCGYLHCDQRFNPLVGALPPLLVDSPAEGRLVAAPASGRPGWLRSDGPDAGAEWLARTFRHAAEEAEARRPGSAVMLPRLAELMYVEVLRQYMRLLPRGETGWLAAARDVQVGHALRLLHERPEHKWTVAELARTVGLSRSALGQRFQALVGHPPIHYLAAWRMNLAQQLLRKGELSISQIAARVGFESDVAFHRAFKRAVGRPPASWRDEASQPGTARQQVR